MDLEYAVIQDNQTIKYFVAGLTISSLVFVLVIYVWMIHRHRQTYWHHGIRLPYQPNRPCWYLIGLSVGCRPWAGHEGDVFIRLIGTTGESELFLINGETYPRLNEAESHLYIYSSGRTLGEIQYIDLICGASVRKKKWFMSSVHVMCLSGGDQSKHWYFPYHKWIEVFLEPVRVTLCGVNVYHDVYKRLLLGWLSRGVSDFHLWSSIFTSLKYTRFRRAERFLCCGSYVIILTVVCMFLNQWVPNLGVILLAVYTSALTALPIYVIEFLLRITTRSPIVVKEDVNWYTGYTTSPNAIDLTRTSGVDIKTLTCEKDKRDKRLLLEEFGSREGILSSDTVFWSWFIDADTTGTSFISIDLAFLDNASSILAGLTGCSKLLHELKKCCCGSAIDRLSTVHSEVTTVKTLTTPTTAPKSLEGSFRLKDYSNFPSRDATDPDKTSKFSSTHQSSVTSFQAYMNQGKVTRYINLKQNNFEAIPQAVWRVDSNYSMISIDLIDINLDTFTLLESMPVSQFDALRPGRTPLISLEGSSTKQSTSVTSGSSQGHLYRRLVGEVSRIKLPTEAQHLSFEEGQLVSMIYFDLCTKSSQWFKPGIPRELFTINTDIEPSQDWIRLDCLDCKGAGKERELKKQQEDLEDLQLKYPEPIPRARVFSMLMFPEYAKKLADAYEELANYSEAQSCINELFVRFAETVEGCYLFCDACAEISKLPNGRQAMCNLFAGARKSDAWAMLICTLSQRLQFQGDNIKRIRRKYNIGDKSDLNLEGKWKNFILQIFAGNDQESMIVH